jgi:hypothetical protein
LTKYPDKNLIKIIPIIPPNHSTHNLSLKATAVVDGGSFQGKVMQANYFYQQMGDKSKKGRK